MAFRPDRATRPVFDYSNSDAELPYVRAELIRHTENGPIRVFLNPFARTPLGK